LAVETLPAEARRGASEQGGLGEASSLWEGGPGAASEGFPALEWATRGRGRSSVEWAGRSSRSVGSDGLAGWLLGEYERGGSSVREAVARAPLPLPAFIHAPLALRSGRCLSPDRAKAQRPSLSPRSGTALDGGEDWHWRRRPQPLPAAISTLQTNGLAALAQLMHTCLLQQRVLIALLRASLLDLREPSAGKGRRCFAPGRTK
jgi:hypothetical protein